MLANPRFVGIYIKLLRKTDIRPIFNIVLDQITLQLKTDAAAIFLLNPSIAYLRPAIYIPYCHHEKGDGSGYPLGLKGEIIPLPARLFAVIDVWDALISDRPYRAAWPAEKVREHLPAGVGSHFDPTVVEVFFKSQVQNL